MRSSSRFLTTLSVCLGVFAISAPHTALACSCDLAPLRWLPYAHGVPIGSEVLFPINAAGVSCRIGVWEEQEARPPLGKHIRASSGESLSFTRYNDLVASVRPLGVPWNIGATFALEVDHEMGLVTSPDASNPRRVQVRLGPALEPLKQPLALELSEQSRRTEVSRPGRRGACSHEVEAAVVRLTLPIPEAMRPYSPVLLQETLVDGRSWIGKTSHCDTRNPGEASGTVGTDVVSATCDGDGELKPGRHTVEMVLTLPGVGVVARSLPTEVNLECSGCGCSGTGGPTGAQWVVAILTLLLLRRRQ